MAFVLDQEHITAIRDGFGAVYTIFLGPISAWRVSGGCSRGVEVVIGRLGAAAAVVQSSEVQMSWNVGVWELYFSCSCQKEVSKRDHADFT